MPYCSPASEVFCAAASAGCLHMSFDFLRHAEASHVGHQDTPLLHLWPHLWSDLASCSSLLKHDLGPRGRRERLLLWLPVIGKHVITPDSPIASWATPAGLMSDADAAIVIVVRSLTD